MKVLVSPKYSFLRIHVALEGCFNYRIITHRIVHPLTASCTAKHSIETKILKLKNFNIENKVKKLRQWLNKICK